MNENRNPVADGLADLLADTYTLYLKTHNFHWNVTGPNFHSLHGLFEAQYTELALAVDEIAERIRTLGHVAPGSYHAFASRTRIVERDGVPAAGDMLEELATDQTAIVNTAKRVIDTAEQVSDEATVDLLVRRIDIHEKNAWMLSSSR